MTREEETILKLYQAVQQGDPDTASECYCEDATYRDIAFDLTGKDDISAMWRLLRWRGVKVMFRDIVTDGPVVKGHWVFDYKFHGKRPVHNIMDSTFTFRDGKILTHHDEGNRWEWARQALGIFPGAFVTLFPKVLRKKAKKELVEFKEKERERQIAGR